MNQQEGDIYLLRKREFIRTDDEIIKIGHTTRSIEERISEYPKGSKLIMSYSVDNSAFMEKEIKRMLNNIFMRVDWEGTESFKGNIKEIQQKVIDVIIFTEKYNIDYITSVKMIKENNVIDPSQKYL